MTESARSAPHIHSPRTVGAIMREVIYALLPGILVATLVFGWGVIIQCLLACAFAVGVEAMMLSLRQRPLTPFLGDYSAVVTGLLLALSLSPFTPWWATLLATAFAVAVAKHLFGGIGHNPFNPAMAGYAFVLLCYPATLSIWPDTTAAAPALGETLAAIFLGAFPTDAVSGATPLAHLRTELGRMTMISELHRDPLFGYVGARGWEWLATAWLVGGLWLLFRGIIQWRIPLAVILGFVSVSLVFHAYDTDVYASPLFHLFSGGLMLAAFFIATDPVSASTTPRGRLIYGAGIGLLVYLIRTFGGYPDGVAFAVLLMNAAVPLIDRYTRPLVVGERRR